MNQQKDLTALTKIKDQLLALGKVRAVGRVMKGSPFRRIPSVTMFNVLSTKMNPILEKLGIKLRLPADYEYKLDKSQNQMNRYMAHMIKTIRNLVKSGEKKKA